jgi:hypothetical protein
MAMRNTHLTAGFWRGVKDGAVEQKNFDTYKLMRLAEMPKVEVVLIPSGGLWGGIGEPTIAVAAPAVLNAITAATGKRLRSVRSRTSTCGRPDPNGAAGDRRSSGFPIFARASTIGPTTR